MKDCNYIAEDYNSYPADDDRKSFDLKHEANPPSKEEEVYRSLADYEHNELPISTFISDYVMDDPRVNKLITDCLKRQFSMHYAIPSAIGENLIEIVSEAFRDYVSMQEDE